jgi:3-oxoacyl-[acyl-carrier protein] reductase
MFELDGRVALVTGAGQGAGAGIARMLAAQGAAVAVNDLAEARARRVADEIGSAGGASLAVDVLVNNAGIPPGMGVVSFRAMDPGEWAKYVDLNLYGVLHCTKAVIDGMCERGFGRVVTISSGAGQVGLALGVSLYAAGKGGAISFMRHLALEVARCGVTANTLALGLMDNQQDEAVTAQLAESIPTGRLGQPEDVAAAVVFLASDAAAWITGQTIGVNGGSTTS